MRNQKNSYLQKLGAVNKGKEIAVGAFVVRKKLKTSEWGRDQSHQSQQGVPARGSASNSNDSFGAKDLFRVQCDF
jgi:hypothetical protein